jgi:hypothetical protein
MTPYALSSHVFVCLQDEHVVFLDVRNDRYFALEAAQTRGLEALVRGWPVRAADAGRSASEALESGVLDLLTRRGLLTEGARAGKDATPIACDTPAEEIFSDDTGERPVFGARELCQFVQAALAASLYLKSMAFERVIRVVHRRRLRATRVPQFDHERARHLTAIFSWLRPYFFTSRDACLFEALALSRFLAGHQIYPRWVFGVQARPFSAHCWLQHEGIVLNDTVEHVGQYTPIMIV